MKVKGYFFKNLTTGKEERSNFHPTHFSDGVFDDEGMEYEQAQLKIAEWNEIYRDNRQSYEYRLDIPETKELEIIQPMKFKQYYRHKMRGYSSRGSVPQLISFNRWDFQEMEIPEDDEGMDAEQALYFVNKKNKEGQEWKYWLVIED